MTKLILKIAVIYLILQYGLKVDINGYVKPYLEPLWQEAQQELPGVTQDLLNQAQENLPELAEELMKNVDTESANGLTQYVQDRAGALTDAKLSVAELEKKMKEMQEAADKAAEGGN